MCDRSAEYSTLLKPQAASTTSLTKFAHGEAARREDLRSQADKQGIGQVTVAPRDTAQQGNDSESAAVTNISRQTAEIQGENASSVRNDPDAQSGPRTTTHIFRQLKAGSRFRSH
mmetsp:Transcript_9456/g.20532  ORF Transcript_9456/g.20532 Transcript_9456/m.20532 type:complete len:115 (-) Transcript_9456:361-705(-)